MNPSNLIYAAIETLGVAWVISTQNERESCEPDPEESGERYRPYVPGWGYLLLLFILAFRLGLTYREGDLTRMLAQLFLDSATFISLYYLILLFILPRIRRRIQSRVCATLWLLPNYMLAMVYLYVEKTKPLLILPMSRGLLVSLLAAWLIGMFVVLAWHWWEHMRFTKEVLGQAEPVTEKEILELWRTEQDRAGFRTLNYPLLRSPAVTSPLSVGVFSENVRVILPEKEYTREELTLIFRHEIIHIGRSDNISKTFLAFCKAMCWYNPLMWKAMTKCAEDMELSCDETVLLGADAFKRRKYAELLLKTAGDDRGFTTCLSATAETMRYRLQQVMQEPKKHVGVLAAVLFSLGLFFGSGCVAVAYGTMPAGELIFQKEDPAEYGSPSIQIYFSDLNYEVPEENVTAMNGFLGDLEVTKLSGEYAMYDTEVEVVITFREEGTTVSIGDHVLRVFCDDDGQRVSLKYLMLEPMDWERFYSFLTPRS